MFGYIRPVTPELKVKEYEHFRACYCGLCHTMGKRYGVAARFILNFDFVYLAMLLSQPGEKVEISKKRCIACPFKKKNACSTSPSLAVASGMGMILTWWKLKDSIQDEPFFKSVLYRLAAFALRRSYRKASAEFPEFDKNVALRLRELGEMELAGEPSIDKTADKFAVLLSAASEEREGNDKLALEQLLYHTGRWIYIVDACDDLKNDCRRGSYNPVSARYGLTDGVLTDDVSSRLETVLTNSRNLAGLAFELLPETMWTDIIRNIIYLGMPEVGQAVLKGTWKSPSNRMKK